MSDSHNVGAFQVKTMFGWRTIEIHRVTWSVEKMYLAAPTRPIIDGETWRGEWRVLNEAGDEIRERAGLVNRYGALCLTKRELCSSHSDLLHWLCAQTTRSV